MMKGNSFRGGLLGGLAAGLIFAGVVLISALSYGAYGSFATLSPPRGVANYTMSATTTTVSGIVFSSNNSTQYDFAIVARGLNSLATTRYHPALIQNIARQSPLLDLLVLLPALVGATIAISYRVLSTRKVQRD